MNYNKITTDINKIDRISSYIVPILLIVMDYMAILFAQKISIYLRGNIESFSAYTVMPNIPPLYFYFIVPAIFLLFLFSKQIYINRVPFWEVIEKVFHAIICSILVCVTMMYFGHIAGGVSRIYVVILGITSFISVCAFRFILKKILFRANILLEPILVIGAGKTAELILKEIGNDTGFGAKLVGFLDDNPISDILANKYPILGGFADAEKIIKQTKVKTVLIAAPGLEKEKLIELINKIQPLVKNLAFVPDLIGTPIANVEIQRFYNARIMMLKMKNNMSRRYNRWMKRIFDLILSLVGLVIIVPVGVVIMILIYIDSPGPVIFAHRRVGKYGKSFPCYKFRTMVPNAQTVLEEALKNDSKLREEWNIAFKLKDDPRITKIGHFLRKTSLDELPQILNVIRGQMSLVGPRPIITKEIERYGEYINDYYLVPPGITGLWQVSGRSDTSYKERVSLDTWYVKNWSVWIDVVLLYKTIFMVLLRKGAY